MFGLAMSSEHLRLGSHDRPPVGIALPVTNLYEEVAQRRNITSQIFFVDGCWRAELFGRQIVTTNDRSILRSSEDDAEVVLETHEKLGKFKGIVRINGSRDEYLEEFSGSCVTLLQLAAAAAVRPWGQETRPTSKFNE